MKRPIKIQFVGFNPKTPVREFATYKLLAEHYDVVLSDQPDYVFLQNWATFDSDDCVKILFCGENSVPDFNAVDYAIGFDHLTFGDRYLRCPLFARYASFQKLLEPPARLTDAELLNRKFCSFVVSNSNFADPIREKFFRRLSQYKRVDSGGRYLNNIGGPVGDKLAFCHGYKFNIAFENSAYDGYTTEKIMQAYAAESVPIYFGNPTVETDFRRESMVSVRDESDIERAVEEVVRLDTDDAAYLAKCRERPFAVADPTVYERELNAFILHIFDQPLSAARRRARYGNQAVLRAHRRKLAKVEKWMGKAAHWLHI